MNKNLNLSELKTEAEVDSGIVPPCCSLSVNVRNLRLSIVP
jgi:hypothetical protein